MHVNVDDKLHCASNLVDNCVVIKISSITEVLSATETMLELKETKYELEETKRKLKETEKELKKVNVVRYSIDQRMIIVPII